MTSSMPREEGDSSPVQFAEQQLVGGSSEGSLDRQLLDLPKPLDVVESTAADDPDICTGCISLSCHPCAPSVTRNRSTRPTTNAAVCWADSDSSIVNH